MNKNIFKSIGAVLAGAVATVVLELAADTLLHNAAISPPLGQPVSNSLFLLATAHRVLFGILGAYITARLAPSRPMAHALVLGAIGVAACILGAALTWNSGPDFGPHWYPLALIALAMPQSWVGAKLRGAR